MLGLTEDEKQKVLTYIYGGADFMFMPSSELCDLIYRGSPETININEINDFYDNEFAYLWEDGQWKEFK